MAFKQICRAVNNLNSPFVEKDGFHVEVKCNLEGWGNSIVTFDSIKKYSMFYFHANIQENGQIQYEYKFTPISGMEGVVARTKSDTKMAMDGKHQLIVEADERGAPRSKIGDFSFELYAFDRDAEIVKKYIIDDKKSFTGYLNENGGIYVFRDGLRIYDYGEKGNDWLQLDIKRVNQPGETISNNLVIGAIYLDREGSTDLVEKANREGFIENEAYETFKNLIESCLTEFLSERNIDKEKYRSLKPTKEPLLTELTKLKVVIEKSSATDDEKKEMDKYVAIIDKEYNYIKTITLTTASAGLTYGVVIHEIEKIIKEMAVEVTENLELSAIREKVMHLSDTIENYANLLRDRKNTNSNLLSITKRAISNCLYRFKAHAITYELCDKSFIDDKVECSVNLIVSSIMNLFDNSIWWMEHAEKNSKQIKIFMSKYLEGYKTLIVVDNGTGFNIRPEDAIKPFVSKKPGGMGVGLNIVNEIMLSHNGQLVFPKKEELTDIDFGDFEPAAIVGLAFKE